MQTKSTANAVGNSIYGDLIMTSYPKYKDSRVTESNGKVNPNLQRWENLYDFNMAEHVNALQDAIISVQRTLGTLPQVPAVPKDSNGNTITNPTQIEGIAKTSTIKKRLDDLETKDNTPIYDKRYGGPTWVHSTKSTLQEHKHTGVGSMPSKIDVTKEIMGLLPKQNINLTKTSSGITGADIYLDASSSLKISESIGDAVSKSTGGVIVKSAELHVLGKTNTRWTQEFDHTDMNTGATRVSDSQALTGQAIQGSTTGETILLNQSLSSMHRGEFVVSVRLSSSTISSTDVFQIYTMDGSTATKSMTIKGSYFKATNKYRNFYMLIENNTNTRIIVKKKSTSSNITAKMDYLIVTPSHPAVFDF